MKKILLLVPLVFLAVVLKGQDPVNYLIKGKALVAAGKNDEAVRTLSEAVEQYKDSQLYLGRAEAHMANGNYSGAINDFNTANSLSPSSGEYGLARIYGLKGDAKTAVYHLGLSLKSKYKVSEKEIMLDPSFSIIESKPEWRQFWKSNWYTNAEKSISEIEYYLSNGNADEAKNVLSGLSAEYPGTASEIYAGALVNYAGSKYSDVIKSVSALLTDDPGNVKYMHLLGKAQVATGNYAGASATFTGLLNIGTADAGLLIQRAECYIKTGETDKAMIDIDRYLVLFPEDKKALSLAGKTEAAAGDNLKALEYFSKNLKLHPNDAGCYIDRANSYFISKSWNWAIKDYSMSLDLQPDNGEVWLNKGISLLNSGKESDACHDFRKAFSMGNKRAADYISRNCIK